MRVEIKFLLRSAYVDIPDGLEPDSEEEGEAVHEAIQHVDLNELYSDYDYCTLEPGESEDD